MALPNPEPEPNRDRETTASLLAKARAGDESARNRLLERSLPLFKRWAHGRLPASARSLADTDDLVQSTLVRAIKHLDGFEPRYEGAFLAYLRRILSNQIRDEIRRAKRQPHGEALSDALVGRGRSPLEQLIGSEAIDACEKALAELPEMQRQALVMRLELGLSLQEVAGAVGSASANAARMLVARGLVRVAGIMRDLRQE